MTEDLLSGRWESPSDKWAAYYVYWRCLCAMGHEAEMVGKDSIPRVSFDGQIEERAPAPEDIDIMREMRALAERILARPSMLEARATPSPAVALPERHGSYTCPQCKANVAADCLIVCIGEGDEDGGMIYCPACDALMGRFSIMREGARWQISATSSKEWPRL